MSHIHLLGKIANLSECAQEELFDLARNNVVDVIKPNEIDTLLEEGLIKHKDDVTEIQIDWLTYLNSCTSRCSVPDKTRKLI